MFRIGEYKVAFKHIDIPFGYIYNHETICTITRDETVTRRAIAGGIARCSRSDSFDKATGRELAFARALQAFVPKQERLDWWKAFWESCDGQYTSGGIEYNIKRLTDQIRMGLLGLDEA